MAVSRRSLLKGISLTSVMSALPSLVKAAPKRSPGPYEQLGDAWARMLGEWLPSSGRRISEAAPSYEVYLNNPMTTPKNELRTEIRIPVK